MTDTKTTNPQEVSKARLVSGAFILVIGFMSPLLIPLVTDTDWPVGVKSVVAGLLAFGIPEVFMLVAVAVLGKQGYEFLKGKVFGFLKQYAPADTVSLLRYRIGLVMFSLPLLVGWIQPYAADHFEFLHDVPQWYFMIGDIVFITSFFVLGGDFWDKLSGLFSHRAKIAKG